MKSLFSLSICCTLVLHAEPEPHPVVRQPHDVLGVELYNQNRIPNTSLSRNLIQNPSFEQESLLWTTLEAGNTRTLNLEHDEVWFGVDDSEAWHGDHSAKFVVWDNLDYSHIIQFDEWQQDIIQNLESQGKSPSYFNPMVASSYVQVERGKPHTLSFYAKSDVPGLRIRMSAASHYAEWDKHVDVALTTEWERYSFTFTPDEYYVFVCIGRNWFAPPQEGVPSGTAYWVDAIQLEASTETSEFDIKPVVVTLSDTSRIVEIDEPKTMTVGFTNFGSEVMGTSATLVVKDMFKNVISRFKIVEARNLGPGERIDVEVDLSLDVQTVNLYTLEVHVESNGFTDVEIWRYAVIDPESVADITLNRMFGFGTPLSAHHKRTAELYRKMGFGLLINNSHNNFDKRFFDVWDQINAPVLYPVLKRYPGYIALRDVAEISDEELDRVTDEIAEAISNYPYIEYWKICNEPEYAWRESFLYDPARAADFMKSIYPKIKAVNPNAKIITPDLANIDQGSLDWMKRHFEAGALDAADIVAIHTYQRTPEIPNLDKQLQKLRDLCARYGFDGEIWITEAGHYLEQHFPPQNLNANFFEGHFDSKTPWFTEDITGYPVGIALSVRNLLAVMKHGEQVTANADWQISLQAFEPLNLIPEPAGMAYHSMARLLGNSSFAEEVRFGDTALGYVFDDGTGQGVAALWDFDTALSTGQRLPHLLRVQNPNSTLEVVDLFERPFPSGNERKALRVTLGYMPVLLRGGSVEEVASALRDAYIAFAKEDALIVRSAVTDPETLSVTVFNRYHEPLSGTADFTLNGIEKSIPFTVGRQETISLPLPLGMQEGSNQSAVSISVNGTFKDADGAELTSWSDSRTLLRVSRAPEGISIDGNADDWDSIPAVDFDPESMVFYNITRFEGAEDLSGSTRIAWDEEHLYLLVEMNDDTFLQSYGPKEVWLQDSLQVFFDMENNGTAMEGSLDEPRQLSGCDFGRIKSTDLVSKLT
jgi:hypothetical protein